MQSKKILLYLLSLALVLGMASAGFAAQVVTLKTTVPNIPQSNCDQAGQQTLEFDNGTVFTGGDIIQFTLNNNVTICKSFDFFLKIGNGTETNGYTVLATEDAPVTSSGGKVVVTSGNASDTDWWYGFRVVGTAGSQSYTLQFGYLNSTDQFNTYLSTTGDFQVTYVATQTDTLPAMIVRLFDENASSDYFKEVDDSDSKYNDDIETTDNALCINTSEFNEEYVYSTPDSAPVTTGYKLTFSGDYTIAHVTSSATYTITWLCKADCPEAAITSSTTQAGTSYTNGSLDVGTYSSSSWTSSGFCTSSSSIGYKNALVITDTTGYFDADTYSIALTLKVNGSTDKDKAIWGATTTTVYSYTTAPSCTSTLSDTVSNSASWSDSSTNSTTLTVNATISGTTVKALILDLPSITFNSTNLSADDQLTVYVSVSKVPCGSLADETLCIANFVTSCTSSQCTMYIPYMTYSNNADYLSALAITNMSSSNGTLSFTLYDSNGGSATISDMAISGNEIKTLTVDDLISQVDSGSTLDTTQNLSITIKSTVNADALCLIFGIGRAQSGQLYGYQARVSNCYSSLD